MKLLQNWSNKSSLHISSGSWYNFAVELIGIIETEVIKKKNSGDGNCTSLQKMLKIWYRSTDANSRNWQTIVDALTKMKEYQVIDSIEKECSGWM